MGDPITWVEEIIWRHPFLSGAIITWITNYGVSATISALPAPTKESTQFYRFCFKFSNNWLAQNPSRANGVRIEHSPNWRDAVSREIKRVLDAREGPESRDEGDPE